MGRAAGWLAGLGAAVALLAAGCAKFESTSSPPLGAEDAGRGTTPRRDAGPPPDFHDAGPPDAGTVVVVADPPPPPVSGGTLLLSADEATLVAADPARDLVHVVDHPTRVPLGHLALDPGAEPGRVTEDGDGRVHVALRGTGEVITIDPRPEPTVLFTREVCASPRGIAWDAATDLVHVACLDGRLITLPPDGGEPVRTVEIVDDLRDVVPAGDGRLFVSRFRSAELLLLDADGSVLRHTRLPQEALSTRMADALFESNTAWRLRRAADGGVWMLHQRSQVSEVLVDTTGYTGRGCSVLVLTSMTRFDATGQRVRSFGVPGAPLAVDFDLGAIDADQQELWIVSASGALTGLPLVFAQRVPLSGTSATPEEDCIFPEVHADSMAQMSSIEVDGAGDWVALQWEQPTLAFEDDTVRLFGERRADTGHRLFHLTTETSALACASCHPEGGDDGHVWHFSPTAPHRTQSLLGGLLDTAPFHWLGDQRDMSEIMGGTFTRRMMGGDLLPEEVDAISNWLHAQPTFPRDVADPEAVARGQLLFEDETVGCTSCHSGEALTDNESHFVGTGGTFQAPSLRGVAARGPWLHDGRADTIEEAIDASPSHGDVSGLTDAERADLVAYVESL